MPAGAARVPDTPAVAVVASPTTRVDGFVRRSGGPSTVWVNGEAAREGGAEGRASCAAATIRASRFRSATAACASRSKPGQVLDRGNGEVRDVLGPGGELRVRPAK